MDVEELERLYVQGKGGAVAGGDGDADAAHTLAGARLLMQQLKDRNGQ